MKKVMLLSVIVIYCAIIFAQTDDLNQKKYWKFRNNFRRDFVKIGPSEGESIPIATRRPIACKDNAGDGPNKGTVRWGDGMIFQGHYIGFLATEYALLKKRNLDVTSTLNELYYALNAINRSDLNAEYYISDIDENQLPVVKGKNLNGFYLRDDAGEFMWDNWSGQKMDCGCNEGDRYITNNTARLNEGGNISRYETDDHSTPSLDQMTSLLVGITVINHLIGDDEYVQPDPELPVMNIKNEALQIANRLITYAYEHNYYLLDEWGWPVGNGGGELIATAYPISIIGNKLLGNDYSLVMKRQKKRYKKAQAYHSSTDAEFQAALYESYSMSEKAQVNRFESENAWIYDEGPSNFELYQTGDGAKLISTNLFLTLWHSIIPEVYPEILLDWSDNNKLDASGGVYDSWDGLPWPANEITFDNMPLSDYNATIIFNLGIASGIFNDEQAFEWGIATKNYQNVFIHALLNDTEPVWGDKALYQTFLDNMPLYGGFKYHGQSWLGYDDEGNDVVGNKQIIWSDGWGGEYKWNDAVESNSSEGHDGQFNALDYLYLHNLYYLVFGDEIAEEYEETYDCFCGSTSMEDISALEAESEGEIGSAEMTIDEALSGDVKLHPEIVKQLSILDFCTEHDLPGSSLSTSYDLKQLFDDYHELDIALNKFQTKEFTINAGGELNIESRLVICNTKELTVEDGGQINLDKGEILIKPGAKLIIKGDVTIDRGTKVIVEDGGEIIIKTGGTLANSGYIRLKEGGKMIYEEDAIFKMQDDFAELHLDGGDLQLEPNALFTFVKGTSQSGQIRVSDWGEHILTTGNNRILLEGNGEDDPILVIDEDADFWAEEDGKLEWISILSGKVEIANNGRLVSIPNFTANNVHFVGENGNRGLVTFDETNISNAVIDHIPIYAALHYRNTGTFNMTLTDINHHTDEIVVKVKGKGYNISQSTFNGSGAYLFSAQNTTEYSYISNTSFNGDLSTVGVIDNSNGTVEIKSCDFNNLYAGVHKLDGKAILRCNDFTNFRKAGAIAHNNCILDLSSNGQGGYNTFVKNTAEFGENIGLWNAQGLILNKGYNYFDEAGSLPIIKGTMQINPLGGAIPMLLASSNRWNVANTAALPGDFNVTSSIVDGLTVNFYTGSPEDGPCPISEDDLIAGVGLVVPPYQDGEAVLSSYNFNQESLSNALNSCVQASNVYDATKSDLNALALFEEVLIQYPDFEKTHRNEALARYGLSLMKQTLQHAIATGEIQIEQNQGSFSQGVQHYVNVLNAMSNVPFNNHNYEQLFYLEMDKAHLFKTLGKTDVALFLLLNAESCALNEKEQQYLNHWKQEWDEEIRMTDYGYVEAEFKDTVWMVTSFYHIPTQQQFGEFGSRILDINTIEYYACGQQRTQMKDESENAILPLMLYPNPNTGVFQIEYVLPEESNGLVIIYDASGKEVYSFICTEGQHIKTLDFSGNQSGAYLYSFYVNEKLEKTGQVIIE